MHEFTKIDLSNFSITEAENNNFRSQSILIEDAFLEKNKYTPIPYEIKKLPPSYRKIYEVEIPTDFNFQPGDSIGLRPPNSEMIISQFLKIYNLTGDEIYKIERRNYFFQGKIIDFFKFEACPMQIVSKRFLRQWYEDVKHPLLLYLSGRGVPEYIDLAKYSLFNLIEFFGKPSLQTLLSYVEIIKPRYFSITGQKNNRASFLLGYLKDGRCSEYFPANNIFFPELISLRQSKLLSFFENEKSLFIATGVGIAAFLKFLKRNKNNQLIYGFRNEEDNLAEYFNIENYIPVASSKGEYVTDYFKNRFKEKIDRLYVCGNINMMKSIYAICEEKYPEIIERKKFYFDSWL